MTEIKPHKHIYNKPSISQFYDAYMQAARDGITKVEFLKRMNITESTYYISKTLLTFDGKELPDLKRAIERKMNEDQFREAYMQAWEKRMTKSEFLKKVNMTEGEYNYCRTQLKYAGEKLPRMKCPPQKMDNPQFLEKYMQAVKEDLTRPEFLERIGLSPAAYQNKKRQLLNDGEELPDLRNLKIKISDSFFEKEYMKAVQEGMTRPELLQKLNISGATYASNKKRLEDKGKKLPPLCVKIKPRT